MGKIGEGRRGRGRPPFVPTAAMKRKVSIAAGAGMPHEHIALGIGITWKTLEKHFEYELSIGAYQRRLEVLAGLHKAARKGSSAAAKAYLLLEPQVSAPPAAPGDEAKPTEGKAAETGAVVPGPVGKKEQANADATTAQAGTDWADLLPSRGPSVLPQ